MMTRTLRIASFVTCLTLGGLGLVSAAAAETDCAVPMENWQPRDAVDRLAQAQNWTVRRIKADDGCYEIKADNDKGQPIEVKIHPATLEIMRIDYNDEHGKNRFDDGAHGEGRGEERN